MHGDDGVPVVLAHREQHAIAEDAGVVHDDVDVAERVDGLLHHGTGLVEDGDIAAVDDRLAAHCLNLGHDVLGRSGVGATTGGIATKVVDDDFGAFRRHHQCVFAADAAAGAGDQRDLSVENAHGPSSG